MSLSATATKQKLVALIKEKIEAASSVQVDDTDPSYNAFCDGVAESIIESILSGGDSFLEVSIPAGEVVVDVVGGSPVFNSSPISCTVA